VVHTFNQSHVLRIQTPVFGYNIAFSDSAPALLHPYVHFARCCTLQCLQMAGLLTMISSQQQQQQQQQQQHEGDAYGQLIPCTLAILQAAAALLAPRDMTDRAVQLQLARSCITAGLLQPLAAVLQHTAVQIKAAEAEVAAAVAAESSLPVPYNRQQPSPLLKLTIALLDFLKLLLLCWPSFPRASPQLSQILQPATRLVLTALRLTLQLLGGGNVTSTSKLYRACLDFGTLLVRNYTGGEQLSSAAAEADDRLMRTALLPQLQLLLLAVTLKTHYHTAGSTPGSSSSGSSRQQRQQQSLHASKHRHLLAMFKECGLSEQQAAAAAPLVAGTSAGPAARRSCHSSSSSSSSSAVKEELDRLVTSFIYCIGCTQEYCKEACVQFDTEQQQQQVQVQQQSGRVDGQQLKQLSNLSEPAALMLLKAAYSISLSDARLAAGATAAAYLCIKLAAAARCVSVRYGIDSSSNDTAAAEDTSAGIQPTARRSERVLSDGSGDAIRPMQQQQ
jgi:hypothetical protein